MSKKQVHVPRAMWYGQATNPVARQHAGQCEAKLRLLPNLADAMWTLEAPKKRG